MLTKSTTQVQAQFSQQKLNSYVMCEFIIALLFHVSIKKCTVISLN